MSFLHAFPVTERIASYGYAAVFVVIALKSAGVPMPGEGVLISAALDAGGTGALNIVLIVAAASAAAIRCG